MAETAEYKALLGAYAMQYAGVPNFKSTVATLRDLHIEADLEVIEQWQEFLENYRRICQEVHALQNNTLDPEYVAVQQMERAQANELRQFYPRFESALKDVQVKFDKAYKDFQAHAKYLVQNRKAASDMFNWIKKANAGAAARLKEFAGGVDPILDRVRLNAGDLKPVRKVSA